MSRFLVESTSPKLNLKYSSFLCQANFFQIKFLSLYFEVQIFLAPPFQYLRN